MGDHKKQKSSFKSNFKLHIRRKKTLIQFLYKSSAVAEMGDRGHNRHEPKRGGAVPLSRGGLGPRLTQRGMGHCLLPYQVASSSVQPFGHNRHGPKLGRTPFRGELRPQLKQPRLAEIYLRIKWHHDPSSRLTTIALGQKLGGGCALFCWLDLGPIERKVAWRPTSIPSGILIHPVVWRQRIWPKIGGCAPLGKGKLGPHLTQCRLG